MTQLVRRKHQRSSASKLDIHLDTPPIATPTDASKANESITQPGEIQLGSTDVHGEQNPLDHITLMMGDSDSDSDSDEVRQAKSSSSKHTSEQDSAENTDADMPLDSKSSLHGGRGRESWTYARGIGN
jgi:hypothetical protein